ncbi:MAG: RidA family protein [Deltaproteobacteria bacterium]|nr:RidA family protein [Deltaproteobacteria bacterium]
MNKEIIKTNNAPAAIGPYSQAVKAGGFIFLSGQIPLDPATGNVVEGGIKEQTERVMMNLEAVLKAAGAGMEAIVKTTIYLTRLSDFSTVNEIYGNYFKENPPARATVEVSSLPRGVEVEIEAVALAG